MLYKADAPKLYLSRFMGMGNSLFYYESVDWRLLPGFIEIKKKTENTFLAYCIIGIENEIDAINKKVLTRTILR